MNAHDRAILDITIERALEAGAVSLAHMLAKVAREFDERQPEKSEKPSDNN